jgi:hypothetical protein
MQEQDERQPYDAPEIICYGTLEELTEAQFVAPTLQDTLSIV